MKAISLNGAWSYRVGYGAFSTVTVPFSRLPVGRSECVRTFDLDESAARVFLKFDGITYYAKVFLNGVELGEMLPYCEYEFEITALVQKKNNELRVVLEDIDRAFGPTEGWENFGGIIRNVSLVLRNASYLENVFFHSTLSSDYQSAEMVTEIAAQCKADARFAVELYSQDGALVVSYEQACGACTPVRIDHVALWSPDAPTLYTLKVRLLEAGDTVDESTCLVGFREITCDRHRFLLNGKPLFLKGVCKHEMVGDSGHCPTPEQIEKDLRMIKEMGCNFVRLVHYPHQTYTLELADRIGLLVSEEPGLWWSDTANEEIAEGSKEVLRRTILRDRNHPSIAFWLCFNECIFTERYLMESAEVCRKYDPTRMVSGANCMSCEDTLVYYNQCGFDFYTMHPYSNTFEKAQRSAEILHDKPLLFTEWGGYFVYNNPHLLYDFMTEMNRLYQSNSDEGALAGAFLWFFAELNDYNRGEPACTDGVLHEGVVDLYRRPTMIYDAFCKGLRLFDGEEERHDAFWQTAADAIPMRRLCGSARYERDALAQIGAADAKDKGNKRHRVITHGAVLGDTSFVSSVPYVLNSTQSIAFEEVGKIRRLSILGMTSLLGGYPLGGTYGENMARLIITYENGTSSEIALQNGVHFTTVYGLYNSSRIEPIAERSSRACAFGYDKNFEQYVMNRFDLSLDGDLAVQRIEICAESADYLPLIYDVFAE